MLGGSRIITCRCAEIKHIDSGVEVYKHSHLHELAYDDDTWETLYGCPETGRLWKEYRVHPEYHGGGWPKLVQISPKEAKKTYGWAPAPDERLRAIRAAPKGGQAYVDTVRHARREFESAGAEIDEIDWNSSRWWRSLWRIGIEREKIQLGSVSSEMPPRKPRPKRAQVEALRDDHIKWYRRRLQECLTPPPAPFAVVVRIRLAAGGGQVRGLVPGLARRGSGGPRASHPSLHAPSPVLHPPPAGGRSRCSRRGPKGYWRTRSAGCPSLPRPCQLLRAASGLLDPDATVQRSAVRPPTPPHRTAVHLHVA